MWGLCTKGGGGDAKGETKWMAVMHLLTSKPFSETSLKKTLGTGVGGVL
jgi:hypothetical protein